MGLSHYIDSLRRGLRRPEVRQHPIRAIRRRLQWRSYWKHHTTPIVLDPWWRNLKMTLPHTSNASLLFYRTFSEPTLAELLQTLLFPQMTFLDVGAHIGEYTVIGAHVVGPKGKVLAIEPLPPCAETIRQNAAINAMGQVAVYDGALCSYSGKIGFQSDSGRSAGWIANASNQTAFETQCWTLDDFLRFAGVTRVDVIKLDAGGNELDVLRGGLSSLRDSVLVMKLYHPNVTQARFGYDSIASVRFLHEQGFQLKLVGRGETFPITRPEEVASHFDALVYSHLLLATKR